MILIFSELLGRLKRNFVFYIYWKFWLQWRQINSRVMDDVIILSSPGDDGGDGLEDDVPKIFYQTCSGLGSADSSILDEVAACVTTSTATTSNEATGACLELSCQKSSEDNLDSQSHQDDDFFLQSDKRAIGQLQMPCSGPLAHPLNSYESHKDQSYRPGSMTSGSTEGTASPFESSASFFSSPVVCNQHRRSSRVADLRQGASPLDWGAWWTGCRISARMQKRESAHGAESMSSDNWNDYIRNRLSVELPKETENERTYQRGSCYSSSVSSKRGFRRIISQCQQDKCVRDPWGRSDLPFPAPHSNDTTSSHGDTANKDRIYSTFTPRLEDTLQCGSSLFLRRTEQRQHQQTAWVPQKANFTRRLRRANGGSFGDRKGLNLENGADLRSLFLSLCVGNRKELYQHESGSAFPLLPLDAYTPHEVHTMNEHNMTIHELRRILGSLLGGDPRIGSLTASGFLLAYHGYKFLGRLESNAEIKRSIAMLTPSVAKDDDLPEKTSARLTVVDNEVSETASDMPAKKNTLSGQAVQVPWQETYGFTDTEWPRFLCGTIDRRWCLQQRNITVTFGGEGACNEPIGRLGTETSDAVDGQKKKNRQNSEEQSRKQASTQEEVVLQLEEFPASVGRLMWPEPVRLPSALSVGLEIQVSVCVGGRGLTWWIDAVIVELGKDAIYCKIGISGADFFGDHEEAVWRDLNCGDQRTAVDSIEGNVHREPTINTHGMTNEASVFDFRRKVQQKKTMRRLHFDISKILEKPAFKEPQPYLIKNFCPPQVPQAAPPPFYWRFRPHRLSPSDIYPGAVICIPPRAAQRVDAGCVAVPSFLLKDAVVHRVFLDGDEMPLNLRKRSRKESCSDSDGNLDEEISVSKMQFIDESVRSGKYVDQTETRMPGPIISGNQSRENENININDRTFVSVVDEGEKIKLKKQDELREEPKKYDETHSDGSESSESENIGCVDGIRQVGDVKFVQIYILSTKQVRIVSVERLCTYKCYKLVYDLHAHFYGDGGDSLQRQAQDFLWAIPRAIPISGVLNSKYKKDAVAVDRNVSSGVCKDSMFSREILELEQLWDEKTRMPSKEWKNIPPFCLVYIALDQRPYFKLSKCSQIIKMFQPELDINALCNGIWRLCFSSWIRPVALPSNACVNGVIEPLELPCLVHHPSDGPTPLGKVGACLTSWVKDGWVPIMQKSLDKSVENRFYGLGSHSALENGIFGSNRIKGTCTAMFCGAGNLGKKQANDVNNSNFPINWARPVFVEGVDAHKWNIAHELEVCEGAMIDEQLLNTQAQAMREPLLWNFVHPAAAADDPFSCDSDCALSSSLFAILGENADGCNSPLDSEVAVRNEGSKVLRVHNPDSCHEGIIARRKKDSSNTGLSRQKPLRRDDTVTSKIHEVRVRSAKQGESDRRCLPEVTRSEKIRLKRIERVTACNTNLQLDPLSTKDVDCTDDCKLGDISGVSEGKNKLRLRRKRQASVSPTILQRRLNYSYECEQKLEGGARRLATNSIDRNTKSSERRMVNLIFSASPSLAPEKNPTCSTGLVIPKLRANKGKVGWIKTERI